MNDDTLVRDALERYTPEPTALPDWTAVLDRAGIAESVHPTRPSRPRRRRRRLLLIVAIVVVAGAIAAPALALLFGLIGRTDEAFTGLRAPFEVQRQFSDLSLMSPAVVPILPGQAREVGVFKLDGQPQVLWVAPVENGGFCWMFAHFSGGCARTGEKVRPPAAGEISPASLVIATKSDLVPEAFGGTILAPETRSLQIEYANGGTQQVPFVFVSSPIGAGFFLVGVPPGHETTASRARALVLLDGSGRLIARRLIPYDLATN